jgi:uncharacterized protein HemX
MKPNTPLPAFIASTIILVIGFAITGYFLYQQRIQLFKQESLLTETRAALAETRFTVTQHETQIAESNQRLEQLASQATQSDANYKEAKGQLAVLRVALQQTTDIKIDSSGALITRKGSKSNGIELR